MIFHNDIPDSLLHKKIRRKDILFGGNAKLKIYGRLNCASGKRMLRSNRVFFSAEKDAAINGYRPCGHCMKPAYNAWKNGFV